MRGVSLGTAFSHGSRRLGDDESAAGRRGRVAHAGDVDVLFPPEPPSQPDQVDQSWLSSPALLDADRTHRASPASVAAGSVHPPAERSESRHGVGLLAAEGEHGTIASPGSDAQPFDETEALVGPGDFDPCVLDEAAVGEQFVRRDGFVGVLRRLGQAAAD
jgi:hypothetical protein